MPDASEARRSDREVLFAALAAYPANGYYAALCYTSGDVFDDRKARTEG
jgi:hypothetical protein